MHQILSRISLAITTHGDLSSRMDQIMQALSEYYSTGQILTAISDNKNGRAELVFTPGHGFKAQNRFHFSEFISGSVERDSLDGLRKIYFPAALTEIQKSCLLGISFDTDSNHILIAPILFDANLCGLLWVNRDSVNSDLTRDEEEMLELAANQIAAIVEMDWLEKSESKQRERAESLVEIASSSNLSLGLKHVLGVILEQLARVVSYDSSAIMLAQNGTVTIVANRGFHSPDQEQINKISAELPHLKQVLEGGLPVIIPDTRGDSRWQSLQNAEYIRCWLGVPLVAHGEIIGLLNLDKEQPGYYSLEDAQIALAFAQHAAITIESAQLLEAAERRAHESETLRKAMEVVVSTLNPDEVIDRILEQLALVIPYESASVQLLRNGYLEILGGRGWPETQMVRGMRFPISDDHPSSIVLESRKPLVLGNAPHDLVHSPENTQRQTLSWMGVPLIVRDNLMGMLSIHSSSQDYFQPDHVRLATTFAAQVAIALENVRLYNAEHQQALESDALRLTLADISAELELSKLLDAVLQRAAELLQASGGELALYNEARKDLFVVSSYNMGRDYTGVRMQVGEGVIGWVAEHLSEVTVEDYNHWEGRSPQLQDVPWYSIIAAPLLVSSRLVGVIGVVDENNQRSFTQSDRRILNLFAQQAAIAVGNAHLYLEARQAADRRAILHRVSQEIISARPEPEDIYEMIHTAATRLAPSEAFVITLYDPENDEIDAVYLVDHDERISPRKVPPDQGLSGYILKTGETIYIEDLQNHASEYTPLRFGRSETIRSVLAVPIRLGNQILGMLSCQSYQPYAYNDEDKYLLEMLASYAAVALTNSRLFNEVQRLAVTDPLTDLYNRRELFELGEREVRRSKRLKRALSLILLDLDDFKLVNDRFGHDVGDRVLVHLAGVLQKSVREIDTLARYGGEEFVILLPETNIKSATIIAERIRKLVNETFVLVGDYRVKVTASIGVTCINADTMDLTEMISVADSAMYTAKNSGRNRVAVS